MALPQYTPPPIVGYTFYSNFSLVDVITKQSVNQDWIVSNITRRFGIPADDILVIDFHPDGEPTTSHHVAFAAYVCNKHGDKVRTVHEFCTTMVNLLGNLTTD